MRQSISYQVMGRHGSSKVVISHHGRHEVSYDSEDSIQCLGSSYDVKDRHIMSFVVLGNYGSSGAEIGRKRVVIGRNAFHSQGNQ